MTTPGHKDEDTKIVPMVPVPKLPRGWIMVPVTWLAGVMAVVMGVGILGTQGYVSLIQHRHSDRDLVLAGVALLTAGTVGAVKARNGVVK